jgi:hypothetical protein
MLYVIPIAVSSQSITLYTIRASTIVAWLLCGIGAALVAALISTIVVVCTTNGSNCSSSSASSSNSSGSTWCY